MEEVIAAGRALGHSIQPSLIDLNLDRTRTMGAYRASTLVDFERGLPLELESLFMRPLRLAQEAKVPTPVLELLTRVLAILDQRRTGVSGG
jgi:2-dehydropantoate 2-reductase